MKRFLIIIIVIFSLTYLAPARALAAAPIKILLVPGHDQEIWGAQYGTIKEAAMNLAVAKRVYSILKKDKRFEVFITRNDFGYTKEFADYFTDHRADIALFRQAAKEKIKEEVAKGNFVERENVPHNAVTEDTSIILYGINKWADENTIDAVIHIHFNDYPRKNKWVKGKYKGFAIYMPDGQMSNGFESGQLAANIFIQLDKKYNSSDYEKELGGLVPDHKLIAMGANNTLLPTVRSVLVEYGYIYEKKFRNYTTRHQAYDNMAKLTAQGIKNYFFKVGP